MNIEFFRLTICERCKKTFELRHLEDGDEYYLKYEDTHCPICRITLLSQEGIKRFSFLRNATIIGYSLEDISETPELRDIELKLANGNTLRIKVKDTRWLSPVFTPLKISL